MTYAASKFSSACKPVNFEMLERRQMLSAAVADVPIAPFALDPTSWDDLGLATREADLSPSLRDRLDDAWTTNAKSVAREGELCALPAAPDNPTASGGPDAGSPFPLSETFLLHTNPGANQVIYLDFDGHTTSGTSWNTSYTGGFPFTTPAYDRSDNGAAFTDDELGWIQVIWQRVAEDYRPYNVDVTTQYPGADYLSKSSSSDAEWGKRVVIGANTWYTGGGAGGVGYVGSFDDSIDRPCFVFEGGTVNGFPEYVAEAASHEAGHTLGLSHDGQEPGHGEYYGGHDDSGNEWDWAPIMGIGYDTGLSQWSRGQYLNATQTQDDLAIIGNATNGFGFVADDHSDGFGFEDPTYLGSTGSLDGSGVISTQTDQDHFRFDHAGGSLSVSVQNFSIGPNLDVGLSLYRWNGSGWAFVTADAPTNDADAFLSGVYPMGSYLIRVDGLGFGNPTANPATGYTDYGSLGAYTIGGTFAPLLNGSTLVFNGTSAADTMRVDVSGNDYVLTRGADLACLPTASVTGIEVNGLGNNDTIDLERNAGKAILVDGGTGNDAIRFSFFGANLDNWTGGDATIRGGDGQDALTAYDDLNTRADLFRVINHRIDRTIWSGFTYEQSIEATTVYTGSAANPVEIVNTFAGQTVEFGSTGGAGLVTDTVTVGFASHGGMQAIDGDVVVSNINGYTTLNLDNSADPGTRNWTVERSAGGTGYISGLSDGTVFWRRDDIQVINFTCGAGEDNGVVAELADSMTIGNTGVGSGTRDDIVIGAASVGGVQAIVNGRQGGLDILNGAGRRNITIDNTGDTTGHISTLEVAGGWNVVTGLAPATIRIDDVETGNLTINTGAGHDTLQVLSFVAASTFSINTDDGNDTVFWNAPAASSGVALNFGTGSGALNVNSGGALTIGTDLGVAPAGGISVNVASGATLAMQSSQHLASLGVTGSASLSRDASSNPSVIFTRSLNVLGAGRLDLNDNDLILEYSGASPLASIQSRINTARAGGAWNGAGITSSAAKNANPRNTTLGVMEASDFKAIYGPNATFAGEAIDSTAVLVKYTYYGDADFNGQVNFDDYARIDNGFSTNKTGWLNGDFDGNGSVNFDDYSLIDLAFNTQSAPLRPVVDGPKSLLIR